MEISLPGDTGKRWTCADLLSSYRFWGMLAFYSLLSIVHALGSLYGISFWISTLQIPSKSIGIIVISSHFGILAGIILSWLLCRTKNRYSLFIPALLALIGSVLSWLVHDASGSILLAVGQFLIGISQGVIILLIPVMLIGGVSSVETFAIVLGICLLFKYLITDLLPMVFIIAEYFSIIAIAVSLTAFLLLLPIKKALFYASPAKRSSSTQQPRIATPIFAALLSLCIPVYIVYWFFKTHQQLQFIAPSSRLMTAQGAGWLSALAPFGNATLCMMLSDEIHLLLSDKKENTGMKTGWVLFWALLLPPVGVAIVQAKMNRVIAVTTAE